MNKGSLASPGLPLQLRILGGCMVVAILAIKWFNGDIQNLLWICNLSTVLAGLALVLNRPYWVLVGAAWMVLGTLNWVGDLLFIGTPNEPISYVTHASFSVIALFLFAKMPLPRNLWIGCFGWFLLAQALSRLLTNPAENINIAHGIWAGWDGFFRSFAWFWLGMVSLCFTILFSLNWILFRIAIRRRNRKTV